MKFIEAQEHLLKLKQLIAQQNLPLEVVEVRFFDRPKQDGELYVAEDLDKLPDRLFGIDIKH